ncbi:hypothetical protein HK104_004486, partial [Borealophlyctis nickersoniae]
MDPDTSTRPSVTGSGSVRTSTASRPSGTTHFGNTVHTVDEDEVREFTKHINTRIGNDPDIGSRMPFDPNSWQLFEECKDGLVLAKLIEDAVPGTIDRTKLNISNKLNPFQMTENNNTVIAAAKQIGCSVVNIGSQDLIEGRDTLILGLIWQIIRIGLASHLSLSNQPRLYRLLEREESVDEFLKATPEQTLLRWVNHHLKAAG